MPLIGFIPTICRDITVRGKRGASDNGSSPRKKPRTEDCIIIDPKPQSKDPLPPVIVLDDDSDSDDAASRPSPTNSTSSPEEWLEDDSEPEMKTCPVCGMANIPPAIINTHVSLCLEAEEQYTIIDDDDD